MVSRPHRMYVPLTLVGCFCLAGVLWLGQWSWRTPSLEFDTVLEIVQAAKEQGFEIHSGRWYPAIGDNCYIGDHVLEMEHLGRLRHDDCGETPAWKGIVWVQEIESARKNANLGGFYRAWGKVLVAGDPELIQRLEVKLLQ